MSYRCPKCNRIHNGQRATCTTCAQRQLRVHIIEGRRVAALVSRETIDPEAEHLARAVADLADELARIG